MTCTGAHQRSRGIVRCVRAVCVCVTVMEGKKNASRSLPDSPSRTKRGVRWSVMTAGALLRCIASLLSSAVSLSSTASCVCLLSLSFSLRAVYPSLTHALMCFFLARRCVRVTYSERLWR